MRTTQEKINDTERKVCLVHGSFDHFQGSFNILKATVATVQTSKTNGAKYFKEFSEEVGDNYGSQISKPELLTASLGNESCAKFTVGTLTRGNVWFQR